MIGCNMDYSDIPRYRCKECGEECSIEEETFDYSGTHCNHGTSGTFHTGHYSSSCCDFDFEDYEELEDD